MKFLTLSIFILWVAVATLLQFWMGIDAGLSSISRFLGGLITGFICAGGTTVYWSFFDRARNQRREALRMGDNHQSRNYRIRFSAAALLAIVGNPLAGFISLVFLGPLLINPRDGGYVTGGILFFAASILVFWGVLKILPLREKG